MMSDGQDLYERLLKINEPFYKEFKEYVEKEFHCDLSSFLEDLWPKTEDYAHEDDDFWMTLSETYPDPKVAVNDLFQESEGVRVQSMMATHYIRHH